MIAVKVFAEGVTQQINEYLPKEYQNVKCKVTEQQKNNETLRTGIRLEVPGWNVSPIVYMEPFYDQIKKGTPMEQVMNQIAEVFYQSLVVRELPEQMDFTDYDSVKDYLSIQIINTKANQRMLSTVPHKDMEDLSVICRIEFPSPTGEGTGSVKVTHELMNKWNVCPEEVYQRAVENSVKNKPPVLLSMRDMMMEIMDLPFEGENLLQLKEGDTFQHDMLYVLSNKTKMNGSAVLAYPNLQKQLDSVFPQGCYLLPSSLHEMVVIPKSPDINPREMGEMVRKINQAVVSRDEVLSDRIYEFDKEKHQLCQVPESILKAKEMER